ncbi:structural maintenance of chromosomes protein 1A-like [Mycetomoellerius zeteki]|uniref:structural maintenance of chromosomes protein 1A-like n=1 Tax=Mycetomoellerius zeteki TaxID=64791 RepID=UPI00084E4C88|nr:PREDICTED: structural maintenance of chromosomes protein 1A-like [Trachymyrmex zeteki]
MSISLNRIVISNFKSFSGKTVIGPIQSFTAIIGPNGAGKSNIVDAISFALGEKLIALRVKRINELVYGISTRESTMECDTYVKLIFNINALDGINKKSFTRAVYGETYQYKIDDKIVTNICYMTELRKIGLDVKAGNFLIPQGYIACVAMKKPKDLTAMFEKITNSNEYKADYDRLKLELSNVAIKINFENKLKKQILIEKKYAIMEKAETEKYLKLKEQRRVEFLQDKERKIKSQIDQYLHDKKNVIILLEDTKSQFKTLSSSLEDIEQDILKMKNIIEQRKIEHIVFEDDILYWQKKRESARISLDSANKTCDTKKRIIQELNNELERIDNELTELRKASQTSTIELSNSQVKRYMELTNEVECRAQNSVKQIKSLMHDLQEDHTKFDNENRRKEELEDKEKQMILKKINLETRFEKLQDLKELSEADIDKNSILHRNKKNETINMLKQFYSGVYGRLFDLCKPIHSRYNVAATKVFGQNINAIVVDTTVIEEPQNVKLLYDVLNILSPRINSAVLFVTKNTLVCETSEHARMLAYPDDKQEAYDCVSLDGCFYRKEGLMSGGQADLIVKAKQWDERRILTLKEQKENKSVEIQKELDMIDGEKNALNNEIFVDFCNDINVPDISYYENNDLRIYQEKKTRQLELEQQYNRIENQLRFENKTDIESKVLKWQQAVEHADIEWNKVYQQERHAKIKIEQKETKISKLKDNYTNVAKDLEDVKKKLDEHKSQISVNEKLYLEGRKAHIAVQRKIQQIKIECNIILKECKVYEFLKNLKDLF